MKTEGISFYFVLYVVAVITVFVITMERDQLLKERDEDIAHLVELYVRPLELTPYLDTASFFFDPADIDEGTPVTIRTKIEGPLDKGDVDFSVVRAWQTEDGSEVPADLVTVVNEKGDGLLTSKSLPEGTYVFEVAGRSNRIIANGNEISLKIKDTTYVIPYSPQLADVDRDTVALIARVEKSGTDPLQFRMTVQDEAEGWILGPPYRKKIFLAGAPETGNANFSAPAGMRIERPSGSESFITLVWNRPVLGKKRVTVTGNANRGYGNKDNAAISFTVDILPPSFVTPPSGKGFWGVPYTFDGRIQGLNPVDLSINVLHNSSVVSEGSAVQKNVFVPEQNWESLEYRVTFRGHVVKKHLVELSAPPPPQIRWVRQELDRSQNVFRISVAATDAANGAVRMSIEAQPSGIARLDKISGREFAISVNLETSPSAVFLKLTASDKFGGRSVSTKQYNIPE